jgi:uncharacterized protein
LSSLPFRIGAGGVQLDMRLTPKGGRDRIDGVAALANGRAVAPEKGAANRALEKLVARWLGVAPSSVKVSSGETARIKTLTIQIEAEALAAAISALEAAT